jgi:hypothetical protein
MMFDFRRIALLLIVAVVARPAYSQPSNKAVTQVTVGAYVNDIQALNLREHSYAIDLYLWFRWQGSDFDPSASIEMVNPNELWGHVSEAQYEAPVVLPSGENYQVIRVQGRFSHKFFFNNYPYDRQTLLVEYEDAVNETNRIEFTPDINAISMNANLVLPGFRVGEPKLVIHSYKYPSDFGDTRIEETHIYSRVTIELPIRRPWLPSTLKMLLPVLCVVLGASIMMRLKVTFVDARFGIGITSLLTVVAIQLAANETMPNVDYLVLMDKIHLAAYTYVLAGLGIVLLTARRLAKSEETNSEAFQSRAFWVLSLLFTISIIAMIASAIAEG